MISKLPCNFIQFIETKCFCRDHKILLSSRDPSAMFRSPEENNISSDVHGCLPVHLQQLHVAHCRVPNQQSWQVTATETKTQIERAVIQKQRSTSIWQNVTNQHCGAERYWRGHQFYRHPIVSQHFVETESSLSVHHSFPITPIQSQTNPVHTTLFYLHKTHFNISTTKILAFLDVSLPLVFFTNILYAVLFAPIPTTYLVHLTLLDFKMYLSLKLYLAKITNYADPHYARSSKLPPFCNI